MSKHRTNIYIDNDLIDWLKKEAGRRECSMAWVVRNCILECKVRQEVRQEIEKEAAK